jgi:hypothetical protein
VPIYLELGSKKVFACSVHWPGWCRPGKSEELAIEALTQYAQRYAEVALRAGMSFFERAPTQFRVVERMKGSGTTDFGAPGAISEIDRGQMTPFDAKQTADLVRASWQLLDDVVAHAPAKLRKGPRGGGRDRDDVFRHVLAAESAYARSLGLRVPEPDLGDQQAIEAARKVIYDEIASAKPPALKGWPPRYAARRIAWHVLDHAWEIKDKSE